jgi:cytochrome c peroxidase
LAAAWLLASCEEKKETPPSPKPSASAAASAKAGATKIDPSMLAVFAPMPAKNDTANPATPEKTELGKMLFFDARLSKGQDVSCNTCHALDKLGADGKKVSEGTKKQALVRNTPTVLDASVQFKQFWDGRAKDVEEASTMSLTDPKQMGMADEKAVVAVLSSMPEYEAAFKKAFPGEAITLANVGKALGAFLRTLLYPSKWDKYLAGDKTALSDDELKGLKAFLDAGCQTCHQGAGLGGTMFQKLGLVKPWPDQKDQGVFDVSKQETDKMMFKVPQLRAVSKTGPYLHDGSDESLEKVVKDMADFQLGKHLTDEQTASIITFLKTLDVEVPADLAKAPNLPKSTAKTPKPDSK